MHAAPLSPLSRVEQTHLDDMFGHDPGLHGEILALFVADTNKRLAEFADALRHGHTVQTRLLAQAILDTSTAMGLMHMRTLARDAVNAGFANDFAMQQHLHAALLLALDMVSNAASRLTLLALAPIDPGPPQIGRIPHGIQDKGR